MMKNGSLGGKISWDRRDPRYLILEGISRDVEIKKGDTVLTSHFSYNYPPGFLIGTVAGIATDKSKGFYLLQVLSAAHFSSLQQVFIVENLQRDEQVTLNALTEQKFAQNQNRRR
jgi:rod shape-determining protein MreC